MIEYMNNLSLVEQDGLKKVIQELFRQTCILKIKYDPETLVAKDNPKYHVCNRHREFIGEYLQVLGCELLHDAQDHIFRIVGDGVPVLHVSLVTTKLILLLKFIYKEKMMGEGLQASTTTLKEIRKYGMETNLLTEKLTMGEWNEALTLMKRHQMLEIPGAISNLEDETPLYIYGTVNLYCPASEINELMRRYQEQEEDGEEDFDAEGEEGIQTFMFD